MKPWAAATTQASTRDYFSELYGAHAKPGLQKLLSLVGLDLSYVRASGERLYHVQDGREIGVFDMLGGYGSTVLGHHHPEIVACARRALDEQMPVHAQASVRPVSALLAEKLSAMVAASSPTGAKPKYIVHLLNTGTEAVEAALKHALMQWGEKQEYALLQLKRAMARTPAAAAQIQALIARVEAAEPTLLAFEGAFHGKTAGALAATHNAAYSAMYRAKPVRTVFLGRDASRADVAAALQAHQLQFPGEFVFSCVIGVIAEVLQGEGGVRLLDAALVRGLSEECLARKIPFIVDEIQSGMYRTGRLLAAHASGVDPDYVTLGKSLGGGLAKISALLVREDLYHAEFGVVHTSTFSEDDFSSSISLRALELLESDPTIATRAHSFESRIREGVERLKAEFPEIIREVRGRGFLMGVEFDPSLAGRSPVLMDALADTGMLTYIFASYLLHRHGVRVAPTLSQSSTIRLEPCAYVSDEAVDATLAGLRQLCELVRAGRFLDVTGHLWPASGDLSGSPVLSRFKGPRIEPGEGARQITFLSHFINADHVMALDPLLASVKREDRERLLDGLWPMAKSVVYHQQEVTDRNGRKVLLNLRGIVASSRFFESCVRRGDKAAAEKVHEAARAALADGSTHIGLGQFTSIVSENGTLLGDLAAGGAHITTGNSLTVGFAYLALKKLVEKRGRRLGELRVGVIGVAGNICNVYAQMLADEAGAMTLMHREPLAQSPKFQAAVKAILDNSNARPEQLRMTHSLDELADCDAIVLGTNTTGQFLMPRHLKQGALVLDISVPSNVHPSVLAERPDVECFQGGYAALPLGQKLASRMVPCPNGETFACMAETVTVGLHGYEGCFSFGPLNKARVLESLVMAAESGLELGSLKKIASF